VATALATFSGQALPRAISHVLGSAAGTSLVFTGSVDASQAAQYDSKLRADISAALEGTPFTFYRAERSDPFGFVAGSLPALPAQAAGPGNVQIVEAAAFDDITAHAALVSGSWPGRETGSVIPAALPATAAALLHVTVGSQLRMKDRISGHFTRFVITGLYRPRQVSSEYWSLNDIALSGSRTVGGFTNYGPLTVRADVFAGPLAANGGSWLAVPRAAAIPAGKLTAVAANVTGLRQTLGQAEELPGLTVTTSLPSVLNGTASNLNVARSLLAICAVLLFLLAGAALLTVARLLAGQREGESASWSGWPRPRPYRCARFPRRPAARPASCSPGCWPEPGRRTAGRCGPGLGSPPGRW
jgi:hypothetical protein